MYQFVAEVAVNAEGIVHGNSDEILELLWRFVGVHIVCFHSGVVMITIAAGKLLAVFLLWKSSFGPDNSVIM